MYDRLGGVRERVWKTLAYLGRYGHQSMRELRGYPVRELLLLSAEVSEIVGVENSSGEDRSSAD